MPRRVRFHVSQSSAEAEALSRESCAGVRPVAKAPRSGGARSDPAPRVVRERDIAHHAH